MVKALDEFLRIPLLLLRSVILEPHFVPWYVAMNFPLVEEEADVTETGIRAQGTPKLFQLGMFAVLMILKGLSVAGGV